MVKITVLFLMGILCGLGFPRVSWSYQISPCYRVLTYKNNLPAQEPVRRLGSLCAFVLSPQERLAVHEHMAAAAIREYRYGSDSQGGAAPQKWQYMMEEEWSMNAQPHRSFAIVFGTWWNDDPLMRTLGQGPDFSRGGMSIWTAMRPGQDRYPGGSGRCMVDADVHLARQSHLGTLQHLHFMTTLTPAMNTSSAQRVDATVESAINWMHFTYLVAIGDIAPDQMLTKEMEMELHLPSIAENHCVAPENVKIRTLFARQGQSIAERNKRTPDVALGSMLHVLQDSFSPAHTCRILVTANGKGFAILRDVENYSLQLKNAHASLDHHPTWFLDYLQSGTHTYENDPVSVGAWLIAAVDRRLPWPDVEAHLRATAFAREPEGVATPGECIGRGKTVLAQQLP